MFATAVFLDEVLRDYSPVGVFNFFHGSQKMTTAAFEEDGLSILLKEPEWLMEFAPLARQYASCRAEAPTVISTHIHTLK